MGVCRMSNERQGAASPRLCTGCKNVMRPKSCVGCLSCGLWDVRRAQSEQAVSDNKTLNFRSLRPKVEASFPHWECLILAMPCLMLAHMQSS